MVLSKLPVLGRPTIWITVGQGPTALIVGAGGGCLYVFTFLYVPICPFSPLSPSLWAVGQGPTALAVGAGGGCFDIFALIYPFSPLSPSLLETARYRLKYCLKGLLNPNQPTNQISLYRAVSQREGERKDRREKKCPNKPPPAPIASAIGPCPTRGGRVERKCWVNFQCRGVLLVWMIVGQGPIALAVGAGGGCLDIFSLIYLFSFLSPSLWETARYRLQYCLKGPLNPKQPTNQPLPYYHPNW